MRLAVYYSLMGGGITLGGWFFDLPRLTSWKGDGISMFANAALCAVMSGASLYAGTLATPPWPRIARLFAALASIMGGLTLFEHLSGVDLGIDTLLAERSWGQKASASPMRMGPPASISFFALGLALFLSQGNTRMRRAVTPIAILVAVVSTLSLVGHLYGAQPMYTVPRLSAIAMQTASMIFALAVGVIASVPEAQPVRALTAATAGGMLARRTLPLLVFGAVALGFLRVQVQELGLVDTAFGSAMRTVAEIALLVSLLWRAVRMVEVHESALRRSEAAIRHEAERKDEFIAILAHELRNPLAPIRNAAHVLGHRAREDVALRRPVEMIQRQVGQMARLIDDLLDVSRISRGALELRRRAVILSEVVQAAIDACRDEIDANQQLLTVDIPNAPIELDADADRLVQVLSNVIGNASKYTPKGGRIVVSVSSDDTRARISVKDTGIGIAKDKLAAVFELFVRVDHSLERQGGLGIGLTLSRQLVELHGGSIEVFSGGLGHGSEFVVQLPYKRPAPAASPVEVVSIDAVPTRRILIADDNHDAAESLALLLQLGGHEVHTAHDGCEAIACAQKLLPEVALLDIGMPKANGYEVARQIRGSAWGKKMYLVALTGWGQAEDKRRAQEAGFDAHLVKPVPPEAIDQLLCTLNRSAQHMPASS